MFKKLKLLFIYIKIIKKNKSILKEKHGISIDWVWRMYKTYVIPLDEIDNVKEYGFKYVNELVKKEMVKIDNTFIDIGLSELVGLMEAVDISEREIGLAFRYKYIDTAKLVSTITWLFIYLISGTIGFFIGYLLGMGIGLVSVFILYLFTRILI